MSRCASVATCRLELCPKLAMGVLFNGEKVHQNPVARSLLVDGPSKCVTVTCLDFNVLFQSLTQHKQ